MIKDFGAAFKARPATQEDSVRLAIWANGLLAAAAMAAAPLLAGTAGAAAADPRPNPSDQAWLASIAKPYSDNGQAACKVSHTYKGAELIAAVDCNHGTFTTHHVVPRHPERCTGSTGKCAFIYQIDDRGNCQKVALCTGLGSA